MFYILKAMQGDVLSTSFNASREFRVRIVERPGLTLAPDDLRALQDGCETVVRACLKGESLEYGLFAEGNNAWDRSVITLVTRRSEGRFVRYRLADGRVADLLRDADRLLAATGTGIDGCESYTE